MSGEKPSFWVVLPGLLTGIAAIITAVGGVFYVAGGFGGGDDGDGRDGGDGVNLTPTSAVSLGPGRLKAYDVTADAYVDSADPNGKFGDDPRLRIDGSPSVQRTLLRFEVTGLTGPVASARLRLACASEGGWGGAVATTRDDWSEAGVSWINQPLAVDVVAAKDQEIICDLTGSGTFIEYDVTSAITGDDRYDFVITSPSGNGLTFHSREFGTPPRLFIQ